MDRLFSAMTIFIEHPIFAAAIGAILAVVGRRSHRAVASAVGVVWLLYALYEFGMKRRWLCSGECNIRVDLLLISPLLWILTIASVVQLIRRRRDGAA